MLSKSDREFFRRTIDEIVRAELRKALTVRMLMEQKRDPKTGQPLAVPVTKEMDVFIPEFWATYLPFYEAAIRGMQETRTTQRTIQRSLSMQPRPLPA